MFRLPVCPNCKTVYHYKDTVDAMMKKENQCYHCQQPFSVKYFPDVLVILFIAVVLSVGTNILMLSQMHSLNLFLLMLVTLLYLFLVIILIPFFVRFKSIQKEQQVIQKRRK